MLSAIAAETGETAMYSDCTEADPGVDAVLMTQRYYGHGNPYAYEFKRQAYRALDL